MMRASTWKALLWREQSLAKKQMLINTVLFAAGVLLGLLVLLSFRIGNLRSLEEPEMRGMIEAAEGCGITLHRAFDVCADPIVTMKKAKLLGVDTILTSGQEADAYAGRELLYELVKLGEKESVTVMVGAGVHSGNIVQLAKDTEAHAFHMSGKKVLQSGMRYRNERVHMGIEGMSEFEIYRTDAEEIRKATEQLHSIL